MGFASGVKAVFNAANHQLAACRYNFVHSPSPRPSPAGSGSLAKRVPLGSFSLREKVAEGLMRVKCPMGF
jgi:hypothetical protein